MSGSGELGFADLAGGQRERAHDNISFARNETIAIRFEKQRRGKKAGAFVAIDEWMVADDAERVCGRERRRIPFAVSAKVLRPRQRGLQQSHVTHAARPAMKGERFIVKRENCGAINPNGLLHFASSRSALR